jgi:hypothetical protein
MGVPLLYVGAVYAGDANAHARWCDGAHVLHKNEGECASRVSGNAAILIE